MLDYGIKCTCCTLTNIFQYLSENRSKNWEKWYDSIAFIHITVGTLKCFPSQLPGEHITCLLIGANNWSTYNTITAPTGVTAASGKDTCLKPLYSMLMLQAVWVWLGAFVPQTLLLPIKCLPPGLGIKTPTICHQIACGINLYLQVNALL